MPQQEAFTEKHYTIAEIAEAWSLSADTVRRLFVVEPGVLKITRPGSKYKRTHTTLRVPESVLFRVHRRMSGNSPG